MEELDEAIVLNSNVSLVTGRGAETIYRIIGEDKAYIYLLEIGTALRVQIKTGGKQRVFTPKPPSVHVRDRIKWPRDFYLNALRQGRLVRAAEHGLPDEINGDIIAPGVDAQLDLRREVVSYIETTFKSQIFSDRSIQAKSVQEAAKRFAVDEDSVRKWMQRHLFYGRHKNALVDHDWLKGAPNVLRRDYKDKDGKPIQCGRPRKTQGTFNKKGHKTVRLTGRLLAEYTNFIQEEDDESGADFPVIYLRWTLSRMAATRDKEGNLIYVPIDPRNFPSEQTMKKNGRRILKEIRDIKASKKATPTGLNGGSVHDIQHEQLPTLQIDGALADNFLTFGTRKIKIEGRGKPTVLLAVCPDSEAIVGWHVTYGSENGDAYRRCVFNAAIPKGRLLALWGVPQLKGFVFGCATEVLTDRGPGISMETTTSLVERFRTHASMTTPRTPRGKGPAEETMNFFQEALIDMAGSVKKTGDPDEDRTRRLKAPEEAVSMRTFMQALLKAISRRNLTMDAGHLLRPWHLKAEGTQLVVGTPAEIYNANKRLRTGDSAWDFAPEDVFRRLCEEKYRMVSSNGKLRHETLEFSSSELRSFARSYGNLHGGKSVEIKYYVVPDAPFLLLWELEGHGLGMLTATGKTRKFTEDGTDYSVEYQKIVRQFLRAEGRYIGMREVQIANAAIEKARQSSKGRVSAATQGRIDDVEKNASECEAEAPPEYVSDAKPRAQARAVHAQIEAESMVEDFNQMPKMPEVKKPQPKPVPIFQSSFNDDQDICTDF